MVSSELDLHEHLEIVFNEWGFRMTGWNIGLARSKIKHRINFLIEFMQNYRSEITFSDGILLIGRKQLHKQVFEGIIEEREEVENVVKECGGDREKPMITVFIGSQVEIQNDFRSIGSGHASALLGGIDCILDGDEIKSAGDNSLLAKRIIKHEPRHAMWNSVLPLRPSGLYVIDSDTLVREALGGPSPEFWEDVVSDNRISTDNLLQLGFWEWHKSESKRLNHHEIFFANPVSKAFYNWAYGHKVVKEWYREAFKLSRQR